MPHKRFWFAAFAAVTCLASAGPAIADTYPNRPVSLVVPFPPGGVTDQISRLIASKMQEELGKPVIVENRPGGGGQIAASVVKQAPADGHSIFVAATEMFAINPALFKNFSYDPLKDFQPVTALASSSLVLIVPRESPANSVEQLIAHAKKQGHLTFASQGIGSIGHLLGEQFRIKTGTALTHVAYKGSAPALQNIMGGQVDMMFDPVITTAPLIATNRVKALAIAAPQRALSLSTVPTLNEAGVPGVDASVWFGMVVKAGTPAGVVARLHDVTVNALKHPDVAKRFADQGLDAMPMTSVAFGSFMREQTERWTALVKATGATAE